MNAATVGWALAVVFAACLVVQQWFIREMRACYREADAGWRRSLAHADDLLAEEGRLHALWRDAIHHLPAHTALDLWRRHFPAPVAASDEAEEAA